MKSQMNLTLFIGDVLVGVVVLIIGIIIAWSSLSSNTDACKIAAGIDSDIISITQSIYSTPGTVIVNYEGPKMCRVGTNNLFMCMATREGWNPNISTIKIYPLLKRGRFGYDQKAPVAIEVASDVYWTSNYNTKHTMLGIYGLYIYSFNEPVKVKLSGESGVVQISKEWTPYGDSLSGSNLIDPLAGYSNSIANTIVELSKSCQSSGNSKKTLSQQMNYILPEGYQISWLNSNGEAILCIDRLLLSSKYRSFDDTRYAEYSYNLYNMELANAKGKDVSMYKNGFLMGPLDFVVNDSDYNKEKYALFLMNFKSMGLKKVYLTWGVCSDTMNNIICSASDTCIKCNRYDTDKTALVGTCTGNGCSCNNKLCSKDLYDPYNQENTLKYHVGWYTERCFDFTRIGKEVGIKNYNVVLTSDIKDSFKASNGFNYALLQFDYYNHFRTWQFKVNYDCSNNKTTIILMGVSQ